MKYALILLSLAFIPLANSATIDATALYQLNSIAHVNSHTRAWDDTNGTRNSFGDVSDTAPNSATGNDTVMFNTYVKSMQDNATLTFSFGANTVGNLSGNDIAIFTLDPLAADLSVMAPTRLDVSIGEITRRYASTPIVINNQLQGVFGPDSADADNLPDLLGANAVILINLDDFQLTTGVVMSEFKIDVLTGAMGENPYHFPTITANGAFNTTVVPIPLPALLFSSGLALLGFVGRRRT